MVTPKLGASNTAPLTLLGGGISRIKQEWYGNRKREWE